MTINMSVVDYHIYTFFVNFGFASSRVAFTNIVRTVLFYSVHCYCHSHNENGRRFQDLP
jgi:hypothetical protein